jgi:hypothetical protein
MLNLSGQSITDDSLARLKGLKFKCLSQLNLDYVKITDAGLAHVAEMSGLTILGLSNVPIGDAGLQHLKRLEKLGTLYMNASKVTVEGVKNLAAALPDCTVIWEGGTIQPIPPAERERKVAEWVLKQGGSLKLAAGGQQIELKGPGAKLPAAFTFDEIILIAPPARSIDDEALENLRGASGVRYILWLNNQPVTDAGIDRLASMPGVAGVDRLFLDGTKVADGGLAHLKRFPNLTDVTIHGTRVTDTGLRQLRDVPKLRSISVGGPNITDNGLKELRLCAQIESLNLGGADITDAGLAGQWSDRIATLFLLNCAKVTDTGLGHLAGSRLTRLDVAGTKVSEAGVKKLATALPACKITWDGGTIEPIPPAERERKVAEWVLKNGGGVVLDTDGQRVQKAAPWAVKNGGGDPNGEATKLPAKPFKIVNIELWGPRPENPTTPSIDDTVSHLSLLTGLEALWIHDGEALMNDWGLERLAAIPTLGKSLMGIKLTNHRITDAGLKHLQKFARLHSVWLAGDKITDAGMEHLRQIPNLQNAYLADTGVGDAGLAKLKGLTEIGDLDLSRTKVTIAGLDYLKAFPRLRIMRLAGSNINLGKLPTAQGRRGCTANHVGLAARHSSESLFLHTLEADGDMHLVTDGGNARLKAVVGALQAQFRREADVLLALEFHRLATGEYERD